MEAIAFINLQIFFEWNVWQSGHCPTRRPDAIHFFVNFDVFKSLYLSEN